jgi:hypothetical protein
MGALTDLFDINFRRECRNQWVVTQEEKWKTERQRCNKRGRRD